MNFNALTSSTYCSMHPDLFDKNGIQSYISYSNYPLLNLKKVQVNYEMHEEDQEDSYPCHQSKTSCHSSLLEMNTISNDYSKNSSFYDSPYNE